MNRSVDRMVRRLTFFVVMAAVPASQVQGDASGTALREGRWEIMVHADYWNDTKVDFGHGASSDLDSTFGLGFGFGYNFSDHLALHWDTTWNTIDYHAKGVDGSGNTHKLSGELDTVSTLINVSYYFLPGRTTPFVAGGIGWIWVDTNIPSGDPVTGCWWDPWWGYICYPIQPTYSSTDTSYNLATGMRWDLSRQVFLRGSVGRQWIDYNDANGFPAVYYARVSLGFKF